MRFPEFSDEWQRTTLGVVSKVSTGVMNTQDKFEDGQYPFYVRSSTIERANRYTYDGIAILTPGDGAIGQIFHYSEGKIAVHQRVYMLTEMQCIPKYLFHYFSARFFERVSRMSAKNTVDSVRMNMITDMPVALPSREEEQQKIASFLSLLDERIEAQRQIIKERKKQKKALLHQLFSQSLRFPEFEDEWQQTTLGRIAEIMKGSGISKDQLSPQGHPCILYGELYTKYLSEVIREIKSHTEIDPSSLILSQAGDVIIPSSGETAIDIAVARCVPVDNVALGGDLNIIRSSTTDGRFLAYQLNGAKKKEIAEFAQGVAVIHLYGRDLSKLRISLPILAEQQKIAEFLSLIDERIEVEEMLLQKYEEQKRYLLRKMFV